VTASSIDTPEPSFRISTPKIFIAVAVAQFGGTGQGDVERQDLIGVPGLGELLHAIDRSHRRGQGTVQRGNRSAGGRLSCGAADERALEDRALRQVDVLGAVELGTDTIDVGDELAAQLPYQIQ